MLIILHSSNWYGLIIEVLIKMFVMPCVYSTFKIFLKTSMVISLAFIKWSVVISYTSSFLPLFRFCIVWYTVSIDMLWQSLDSQQLLLQLVATKLFTLFITSLKFSSGTLLYNWSYGSEFIRYCLICVFPIYNIWCNIVFPSYAFNCFPKVWKWTCT